MKLNLTKRIIFSYSAFLLIFSTVFFTFYSTYVYRNLTASYQHNLEQLAERTCSEIDSIFQEMDNILLYVVSNPDVCESFTKAYYEPISDYTLSTQIGSSLTSVSVPNNASKFRINLFNRSGNFVSTGLACSRVKQSEIFDSEDYADWYNSLPVKEHLLAYCSFQQDYLSTEKKDTISLYRAIYDSKRYRTNVGTVEIQCPYDFFDGLLNADSPSYLYVIFDANGEILYPKATEDPEFYQELYAMIQKENMPMVTFGKYVYSYKESDYMPFTLAVLQLKSVNTSLIMPILLFGITFFFVSMFLGVLFIIVISKKATSPLLKLMHSVEQVTFNSQKIVLIDDLDNDEIAKLNSAFSNMFQRLRTSSEEIIKTKDQELNAQRIALQSQMNPHFLFNMLTIIKAFSKTNETEKIAYTCDYLADIIRYCGNYENNQVSIETEVRHTENYLKLMKIRYEEMFTYQIQLDSNLYTAIQIPKLSLQPVIENCFQHGFKHTLPPWNLQIRFWIQDCCWFLSIADNGIGISREKIQEIYKKAEEFMQCPADQISKLKIGGMGLLNTIVRLRLSYKGQVNVQIKRLPKGTEVVIGGTIDASNSAC